MAFRYTVLLVCVCAASAQDVPRQEVRKFPEGFLFGTATASYQIEGGWNADGKTESIWDHIMHTNPDFVEDLSNGDIADNSYYLYKRDVQMLRELGVDFYRFSISWNRILPSSFPDKINEAGVQYYNNLIDELLKYNIQPMITLFHWDLPKRLQDLGGLANPEFVTWFSDYARTVFTLFGDRVRYFITINEPHSICYYGYELLFFSPTLNYYGVAGYLCSKYLLLAHAKAYSIYDEEFRPSQKGNIFISFASQWYEPASDSEADVQAAHEAYLFQSAQYSWPIFSDTGDFPPEMKEIIAAKSAEQGFPRSRLPEFTPEEIDLIKGSSDFFGLNHYSSYYIYRNETVPVQSVPSFLDDFSVGTYEMPDWQIGESNYTMYVPWGFRKLLNRIKDDYNNPQVYITENGFATKGGLHDNDRVQYYRGYMGAVLDALEDGCDIRSYTAWSLMDNFEWHKGYQQRFGLYEVNYESIYRTRTPRKSAYVYKEILRTRELDESYEPDMSKPIAIDAGHG